MLPTPILLLGAGILAWLVLAPSAPWSPPPPQQAPVPPPSPTPPQTGENSSNSDIPPFVSGF